MAVGDFIIQRNAGDTTSVDQSNYDSTWDTLSFASGTGVTYASGLFTVSSDGPYLVLYNERFDTLNTTSNERFEIQGEILVNGSVIEPGKGQDFIRKSSGQQETVVSGAAMVQLLAGDTIQIRFYRTDNSTTGTCDRVPGWGAVQVLSLDDSGEYGFYSSSADQVITTALTDFAWDVNDRQDTGISRSGSGITLSNAGRYLVCIGGDANIGTSTDRTEALGELRLNGTVVPGTRNYCYIRGFDGCHDGALSSIHLLDAAANDVLSYAVAYAGGAVTLGAGFSIQVWRIPASGNEAIVEATSGDMNADGPFAWDTSAHSDSDFSYTAGSDSINVNAALSHCLVLATVDKTGTSSPQRAYPIWRPAVNTVTADYGGAGVYHRNSSGIGRVGLSVAAILPLIESGDALSMEVIPLGDDGVVTVDRGQFAVINLASIFSYAFPPVINDADDEQFDIGESVTIDGARFEATQGSGQFELSDSPVYGTSTLVTQPATAWSDTQATITIAIGALPEGLLYLFSTNDSGATSPAYAVSVGRVPYGIQVAALAPDHYWEMNNSVSDTGSAPARDLITDSVGPPPFVTEPIDRDNTHSLAFRNVDHRLGCADNSEMNISISHQQRIMGGWIQLGTVQLALASLYKEGGGVNNMCFLKGLGNVLVAQVADSGEFTVQAFSDFRLAVDRPYHICVKWEGSNPGLDNEIALFIDGIRQQRSSGPPNDTNFDSHSGDINWGSPDSNLEMGGSDVRFAGADDCLYSHWLTWSTGHTIQDNQIFDTLFLEGAIPDDIITSGTEAEMQLQMDAFASTSRRDWPISFEVAPSAGDVDFSLDMPGIVFDDRVTVHIVYRGSATLSLRAGGSNIDPAKIETPLGGTVVIVSTASLSVEVEDLSTGAPVEGARVRLEASAGGPLPVGTAILEGLTNASGVLTGQIDYTSDQPIVGRVRKTSPYYKTSSVAGVVTIDGFSQKVFMISDE